MNRGERKYGQVPEKFLGKRKVEIPFGYRRSLCVYVHVCVCTCVCLRACVCTSVCGVCVTADNVCDVHITLS